MQASAIQKIFTFSQKAERISGKVDRNSCQLKNWSWISDQPGDLTIAKARTANATSVLTIAARTARRPSLPRFVLSGPGRLGGALLAWRVSIEAAEDAADRPSGARRRPRRCSAEGS
jgi:hypothetical protein